MKRTIKERIFSLLKSRDKSIEIGIGVFDDNSASWIDFEKTIGNKNYVVTLLFNEEENEVIDFTLHETTIKIIEEGTEKIC